MSRKYTRIEMLEKEILKMRESGKSRREIWEHFGLCKKQYENFLNRYNRKQKELAVEIVPGHRGRPSKASVGNELSKDNEIKRLKMENSLLRDFLYATGRK